MPENISGLVSKQNDYREHTPTDKGIGGGGNLRLWFGGLDSLREEWDEVNKCTPRYSLIERDENCCVDTCHYLCLSHQHTSSLVRKSEKFSVWFPKQKILVELLCQSSPATFEATCKHEAISQWSQSYCNSTSK